MYKITNDSNKTVNPIIVSEASLPLAASFKGMATVDPPSLLDTLSLLVLVLPSTCAFFADVLPHPIPPSSKWSTSPFTPSVSLRCTFFTDHLFFILSVWLNLSPIPPLHTSHNLCTYPYHISHELYHWPHCPMFHFSFQQHQFLVDWNFYRCRLQKWWWKGVIRLQKLISISEKTLFVEDQL